MLKAAVVVENNKRHGTQAILSSLLSRDTSAIPTARHTTFSSLMRRNPSAWMPFDVKRALPLGRKKASRNTKLPAYGDQGVVGIVVDEAVDRRRERDRGEIFFERPPLAIRIG